MQIVDGVGGGGWALRGFWSLRIEFGDLHNTEFGPTRRV